jgi:hypothetical protein
MIRDEMEIHKNLLLVGDNVNFTFSKPQLQIDSPFDWNSDYESLSWLCLSDTTNFENL